MVQTASNLAAVDEFESFVSQSLTTDLSVELGNILSKEYAVDWSKNSFYQEAPHQSHLIETENLRRLIRLEDSVSELNQKLNALSIKSNSQTQTHSITEPDVTFVPQKIDNEDSANEERASQKRHAEISSKIASACKELDSLKKQMESIGLDTLNESSSRSQERGRAMFHEPSKPIMTSRSCSNEKLSTNKQSADKEAFFTKQDIVNIIRSEIKTEIHHIVHESLEENLVRIAGEITKQVSINIAEELKKTITGRIRTKSATSEKEVRWERPIQKTCSASQSPSPIPRDPEAEVEILLEKLRNKMSQKAKLEQAISYKKDNNSKKQYWKPTLSSQLKKKHN